MAGSLRELWQQTVRAAPRAAALHDAAALRTWTRAELDELGAAWSVAHGAEVAGQVVVFAEPNGPAWLRVFLGLLASDAVIAALDPGEPLAAQRSLAASIGATFLWHNGRLERIGAAKAKSRRGTRLLKITSGSTGTPRALRFTDAQLLADGRQVCATMGIKPADINLGCIPFGHSYGLGNLVLPLLLQGSAIVSGVSVLPHALAAGIAQWKPIVFPAVPVLLRALVEAGGAPEQLKTLRTVISAGAPLSPEIARAFRAKFGLKLHSFYGSSETGGITYDRTGGATLMGRSVGTPLEGVRLRFGPGRRFWVESAAVSGGGRFRPPDHGELNERGELVLLGRSGRMVKIGGRRLDLAEVERALREVPGVSDAFVVLHAGRADALAAAVATNRTAPEIREALRDRLVGWKIPKKIVTLAAFPVTARGKTDTRQLGEWLAADAKILPRGRAEFGGGATSPLHILQKID